MEESLKKLNKIRLLLKLNKVPNYSEKLRFFFIKSHLAFVMRNNCDEQIVSDLIDNLYDKVLLTC